MTLNLLVDSGSDRLTVRIGEIEQGRLLRQVGRGATEELVLGCSMKFTELGFDCIDALLDFSDSLIVADGVHVAAPLDGSFAFLAQAVYLLTQLWRCLTHCWRHVRHACYVW